MIDPLIPPIYAEIHNGLAGLVNGKAHPGAIEHRAWPAIRYQQIASEPLTRLGGETNLDRTVWRIDVFAADYTQSISIARRVRDLMQWLSTTAYCVGENDLYDEDARVYQRSLDFEVWVYRPANAASAGMIN